MTTRAEEIAAEGPYSKFSDPKNVRWYVLGDPDPYCWELDELQIDARVMALNAAYKQGQQDRWIPVSERLPEEGVKVMVTDEHGTVELALLRKHYDRIVWADSAEDGYSWWIMEAWTHWMPLPPNPEQP